MARSQRVRCTDLDALARLLAEVTFQPAEDPGALFRRMLVGLRKLLDCTHTGLWLRRERGGVWEPIFFEQAGLAPDQRAEFHRQFLANKAFRQDPLLPAVLPRLAPAGVVTLSREELIDDGDWYRSAYAMDFRRRVGFDHTLMSAVQVQPGLVFGLGGWNDWGGRDFGERQRRLLHLANGQLGWLVGQQLCTLPTPAPNGQLSPRERQTLTLLLQGLSEKELAASLGVSRPTAHQYVGALFQKYGAASRAELMARFITRPCFQ